MPAVDPQCELVAALLIRWNNTSALDAIAGPYKDELPTDQSAFPYCVYKLSDAILEQTTCHGELWGHEVEFRIYDKTPELAKVSFAKVHALYGGMTFVSDTLLANDVTLHKARPLRIGYRKADKGVEYIGALYAFETYKLREA
jgi:hypothetical protein